MGRFIKGDIVVVPFPFSDLSTSKRRPALVLAASRVDDLILCQITSQTVRDDMAVTVAESDIEDGTLNTESNVRPNKLFTADKSIILYRVGTLQKEKLNEVVENVVKLIQN